MSAKGGVLRGVLRCVATRGKACGLAAGAGMAVLLAGCGSSRPPVPEISQAQIEAETARQAAFRYERLIDESRRLQSAAFPLLAANARYCGGHTAALAGLSVLTLENLHEDLRRGAGEQSGIDGTVRVVQAVKDSPARRAGLAPGDRILRVAGRSLPAGLEGTREFAGILNATAPGRPLDIAVMREGRELTFTMRPVAGCAHPVVLSGQQGGEDLAEEGGIVIPRPLVQLAENEDELALAIAHELGHLVAGHIDADGDAAAGIIGGFPAGTPVAAGGGRDPRDSFSHNHEKVADYLGLYFAARAGFDIAGAARFWRKVADQNPETFGFGRVHPASAERFVIIAETKKEIARKRENGAPVEPNWENR